tara:strand:+ start:31 stop:759 length:729 start_codon:yes stop_codon:yes gene_type:complete
VNKSDYSNFEQIVNADNERRGKPLFSGFVLGQLFEDLEDITIEQFVYASKCHRRSAEGMFALSAANVRKQLGLSNVQDLKWHDVLVMAKAKNTPLAIIASRYVKSYDLQHQSDIENKGQCDLFLHDLPKHLFRLENGEFTQHELIMCGKYGVDPRAGIHTGHGVLPNNGVLTAQIELTKESAAWGLMIKDKRAEPVKELPPSAKGQLRVARELANVFSDVQPKKEYTGAEAEKILINDLGEE